MPESEVTEKEVLKLLAYGPDMVKSKTLRDIATEIAPILIAIFRRNLACDKAHVDWNKAKVSAIFRMCDRFKTSIYHPVR